MCEKNIPTVEELLKNLRHISPYIKKNYPVFYETVKGGNVSKNVYDYFYGEHKCICGKPTKFLSFSRGYQPYCSRRCCNSDPVRIEKTMQKQQELYGGIGFASPQTKSKIKKTSLLKYGDENYSNRPATLRTHIERYGGIGMASPELKMKTKQTMLDNYGGIGMASQEIRSRIEKTNLDRYGVKNPFELPGIQDRAHKTQLDLYGGTGTGSPEIRRRIEQTNIDKYGAAQYKGSFEYTTLLKQTHDDLIRRSESSSWIMRCPHKNRQYECCKTCDGSYETDPCTLSNRKMCGTEQCTKIQPIGSDDSTGERELAEYIQSIYDGPIERGWNNLYFDTNRPKQIDIYLPELNLGIEYNGIYFHSLNSRPADYHFKKWKSAKDLGIRLITIWDFQWNEDREGVESFIKKVLEGDKETRYGDRIDGMSYNDWISIDIDDVILERQKYEKWTYVDCGKVP